MQSTSARASCNLNENSHVDSDEKRKSHNELIPDISSPSSFTQSPFQPVCELDHEEFSTEKVTQLKCILLGDSYCGKSSMVISYTSNGFPDQHKSTAFDIYKVDINVEERRVQLQICDTGGGKEVSSLRHLAYPDCHTFILCFSVIQPTSFYSLLERWLEEIVPYLSVNCADGGTSSSSESLYDEDDCCSSDFDNTSNAVVTGASTAASQRCRRQQYHDKRSPHRHTRPSVLLVGCQCDERINVAHLIDLSAQGEGPPITEKIVRQHAAQLQADAYVECSALTQKNLKRVFDLAVWHSLQVYDKDAAYDDLEIENRRRQRMSGGAGAAGPSHSRGGGKQHHGGKHRRRKHRHQHHHSSSRNSKVHVNKRTSLNSKQNSTVMHANSNNSNNNSNNNNNNNNNSHNSSAKLKDSSSFDTKLSWKKLFCLS